MRPTTQVTGKENDMTKARIDGVELKISEREPLLAGTVGLNKISLSFSDEWAIFTKQIDFTNEQSGETRRISAEVGVCTVPWELLRSEGDITCYVRGIGSDGSLVLRTNEANLGTVLGSADGNVPGTGTPTPDVCDEKAAKIGDLSKLETDEKSQLVGAINEVKRKTDSKQDKLTAGDNITIAADGTISSTGGGAKVFFLDVFVITETEVITNKTYAEIKAAIDAGDSIYITDKNGIVYVPQVGTTNTKIELLWIESQYNRTLYWTAVVDSENAWSAAEFELVDIDKLVFELSDKVDKETGKGLSTNDYTYADKAKVDAIPASPKYTDTVYNDTAVKNRLTAIENKENVTLTANTARISNVSCTAKYFPLLGMVFVRIYGKICADLNVGYDYDLFTVGSRVPDSNAALSVKCGKNAMALAKTSSSGSAIQIRPLESGINGYDVFITGFWFA